MQTTRSAPKALPQTPGAQTSTAQVNPQEVQRRLTEKLKQDVTKVVIKAVETLVGHMDKVILGYNSTAPKIDREGIEVIQIPNNTQSLFCIYNKENIKKLQSAEIVSLIANNSNKAIVYLFNTAMNTLTELPFSETAAESIAKSINTPQVTPAKIRSAVRMIAIIESLGLNYENIKGSLVLQSIVASIIGSSALK